MPETRQTLVTPPVRWQLMDGQPLDWQPLDWPSAPNGGGRLPHGYQIGSHVHGDGLLVYAVTGVVATVTTAGTWLAVANRVIWTPPGFEHAHRIYGETDVRAVSIPRDACELLPPHPGVFAVSALLREVLLALAEREDAPPEAIGRLRAVLVDELAASRDQPIHLPEPQDDRLRAVTDAVHADPAQSTTLKSLGRAAGASERTLSRLFHDELGMSFHQWRTTLRIHLALLHLSNGLSVTATATACGWANPTSFIEAFTAIMGQTPGRYQSNRQRQ